MQPIQPHFSRKRSEPIVSSTSTGADPSYCAASTPASSSVVLETVSTHDVTKEEERGVDGSSSLSLLFLQDHPSAFTRVLPSKLRKESKEEAVAEGAASLLPLSAIQGDKAAASLSDVSEEILIGEGVMVESSHIPASADEVFAKRFEQVNEGSFHKTLTVLATVLSEIPNTRLYRVRGVVNATRVEGILKVYEKLSLDVSINIQSEATLLGGLKYPGVPQVIQYDDAKGYILTTAPTGKSLYALMSEGKIDTRMTQRVIAQLACIVEYLRRKQVALFDYSLTNVFVDMSRADLPVSILSAEFARKFGETDELPFMPCGATICAAPEMYSCLNGAATIYDPYLTQWWALGVLLFMLTFHSHPFVGRELTTRETIKAAEQMGSTYQLRREMPYHFNKAVLEGWLVASRNKGNLEDVAFDNPNLETLIKSLLSVDVRFRGDFTALNRNPWLMEVDWRTLQGQMISCIINKKAFGI